MSATPESPPATLAEAAPEAERYAGGRPGEPPAIRTSRLSKAFAGRMALRTLSVTVRQGERVAVLGPNGAGKSTLLRILALLVRPTAGSLEILGLDARHDGNEIRRTLGVVLHDSLLYDDLTVAENLNFFGKLYGVRNLAERRRSLLARLDLERQEGMRVRHLSRGQRQRLSLARALVHDPQILLLDEPDTGQDVAALERVQREILADQRRTVVFTTHHPSHALEVATRAIILAEGRGYDIGPSGALSAGDLQRILLEAGG